VTEDAQIDRRSVLKATASAAATGLTAAGIAAGEDAGTAIPSPGCVETTGDTELYASCAATKTLGTTTEGTAGFVTDQCYDDAGNLVYEFQVECQDVVYVYADDTASVSNCC